MDSLKYKVIVALKKVNNKSHDFVQKMNDHSRATFAERMHSIKHNDSNKKYSMTN